MTAAEQALLKAKDDLSIILSTLSKTLRDFDLDDPLYPVWQEAQKAAQCLAYTVEFIEGYEQEQVRQFGHQERRIHQLQEALIGLKL